MAVAPRMVPEGGDHEPVVAVPHVGILGGRDAVVPLACQRHAREKMTAVKVTIGHIAMMWC